MCSYPRLMDDALTELRERMPKTASALEEGLGRTHLGAQVYVSLQGDIVADAALGQSRPGVAMGRDTLVLWMSMGKPITAILLAKLVDGGHLNVHQPVADVIEEFGDGGKESITLAHLLTHTGGFRNVGSNWSTEDWDGVIARISASPLEEEWVPGETAGYHVASSWYILAEVARRTFASLDFAAAGDMRALYRHEIFEPLGMNDCWIGMPRHTWIDYGTRIGLTYDTSKEEPRPMPFPNSEQGSTLCRPGGNARGPVNQLGRFYETLLHDRGNLDSLTTQVADLKLLSAETARLFTARHRVGMKDRTFGAEIDWGYGFLIPPEDGRRVPYGYGPHASPEAFGHSGNQSSCAFADPKHGLVACWATNGLPGELAHQKRQRAINAAIYEDLDLG